MESFFILLFTCQYSCEKMQCFDGGIYRIQILRTLISNDQLHIFRYKNKESKVKHLKWMYVVLERTYLLIGFHKDATIFSDDFPAKQRQLCHEIEKSVK